MTTDPNGEPWGVATYHGSSAQPPGLAPPPRRAAPSPRAMALGGGVLVALALGLTLGFLARPHLIQPAAPTPMRAVSAASGDGADAPGMAIEVNRPAPLPVAKASGKLEVLPPDMVQAAPRLQAPAAATPQPADIEASPPVRTPQVIAGPIAPPRLAATPFPAADPACAAARSRAAQMVCADPELAAADREMNRAYRRALNAGVDPGQLRDDQRDWLAIREDAARQSPRAVASIYAQRIDELNEAAADDGPG